LCHGKPERCKVNLLLLCDSDSGMGNTGFLGELVFGRLFYRTLAGEQTPGVRRGVDWGKWFYIGRG